MLIADAKGFAKEVLEALFQANFPEEAAFYDDTSYKLPERLHGRFSILRTAEEARRWLAQDPCFALGTGSSAVRRALADKLHGLGGVHTSVGSPRATICAFGTAIGAGCSIMTGAVRTSDISLGEGVLVNMNCTVGHDCTVGPYCELSLGVHLSGP